MSPVGQLPKVSSQVQELANNIGSFIEYWGFKQVHGRIWTLIFLAPRPVDANYLIENLGISKALVSMSIKDLLYYDVILEVEKQGPSTQKYTFNPDLLAVITDVLRKRECKMLVQIRGSHELVTRVTKSGNNNEVNTNNLNSLGDMITMADQYLSCLVNLKTFEMERIKDSLTIDAPTSV